MVPDGVFKPVPVPAQASQRMIMLDRFPPDLVDSFSRACADLDLGVVAATTLGDPSWMLQNFQFPTIADYQAAYGELFDEYGWSLGEEQMHFYRHYEGLFIVLLSRFAVRPSAWAAHEMSTHFFKLANWAEGLLLHTRPDAVISYFEPHDPSSFAMYLASKRRRIPYLFLDAPRIANVGRYLACSFSNRMLLACNRYGSENVELRTVLNDYSSRLSRDYLVNRPNRFLAMTGTAAVKPGAIDQRAVWRRLHRKYTLAQAQDELLLFVKNVATAIGRRLWRPAPYMLKIRRGQWADRSTRVKRISWLRISLMQRVRLARQKRTYERLAKLTRLRGKYLLLALPSQPEGSTLPAALHQHDLELLVRKILEAMPAHVQLLIKAHPVQFVRNALYTSAIDWFEPSYFQRIVESGKGRIGLVSLNSDAQSVLDGAVGVVVVNGSLGFEALARGKPVIHTASIWYEESIGASRCTEISELKAAISQMLDERAVPAPTVRFADSSTLMCADPAGELREEDMEALANKFKASLDVFQNLPTIKWLL